MHRFMFVLHALGLVVLIFSFTKWAPRLLEELKLGAGNIPVMSKPVWRIV